ncbi:DUF4258 domain-containing protein [Microvirga subterranea]|uniref:Uncharacterized protein DUF4258 n=1 Tax=Microvirga subterranea TaxID=186651 RepID=A0A370HJW4_9HYPH|nr:DUF4258 domain-containing protein [Microvirga subterranea]RDI58707.1 uncharacterized protein DUF4258 [Microvirga subterranea]
MPLNLSIAGAFRIIREIVQDTNNIVVLPHGRQRGRQRNITRRQIELCVQRGTIVEGPFVNQFGHWQVTLYRHAAGEEITCVLAIEWATKVLVITTF